MKSNSVLPVLTAVAARAASAAGTPNCYSSLAEGDFGTGSNSTFAFLSYGSCREQCRGAAFAYSALQGETCTCGAALPPASALVGDDECNTPCPGYPLDICGGPNAWTIIDTVPGASQSSVTDVPYYTANSTTPAPTGVHSSTTTSASATSSTSVIPTAGAVAEGAYLGGVAAAMGLGVVYNLF
ncbi:uncharacterized protein B0I36DRAFT_338647 [Microdochium trichocladiopsis]|uniref:WSC domain-containing protein n=1 Tax=Microdochium trichocladiopsis TaxID=1682393 RepID=A0A9P8XSF9_9PEZI|nr:uncharacterized protein B0I36DRAFT_338647 [Microdochium trichocladiopsis]KAH7014380.1 hypothetical protein B0I36DRAFT_338647 [Microdochium trichocladiopsis]